MDDKRELFETVDVIWTLWEDIFNIRFQTLSNPTYGIWLQRQLQNVNKLQQISNQHRNYVKFDEIKIDFIAKIGIIKDTYLTNMSERTIPRFHDFNVDMVTILKRLEKLHGNDNHCTHDNTHSIHCDTDRIVSPVTWLYLAVDNIWDLLHKCYQTSFKYTKSTDNMTKVAWNAIQTQNISDFLRYLPTVSFNYTLNETQKQFIHLIFRMKKINQFEPEYTTYMQLLTDIKITLQKISTSNPELIQTQFHSAIHRLISICEKLADQKMLGSEPL